MNGGRELVAIVGAGAMGAMYAEHFAGAGFDVALVARGERAQRLSEGVTVNGVALDATVIDADRGGHRTADLVIFAVKDRHLAAAIDDAAVVMGPDTIVLSVLNGLDSEAMIADRYGDDHVLLCVALGMDAEREGNDVRYRQPGRLLIGRARPRDDDADLARLQGWLDRAGLVWATPDDMVRQLWWKFMVNVGINQASAIFQAPYGAFQIDGDERRLMNALMDEVLLVAHAEGVPLDESDVARWHGVLANQPAEGWTSMAQDVLAGRPTEVDAFGGRVVSLGAKHGIATPHNARVVKAIRAAE